MVTMQIDWLTLSCVTSHEMELGAFLHSVLSVLRLADIWDKFEFVGRDKFYPSVYRYNNISVLVCSPKRLLKQGICIRFSGNGLAFYQEHLKRVHRCDLQAVCKAWRSFSVRGFFTRCTRFDYAIDNIAYNDESPLLTLRKVKNCVKKREFRSRLTTDRGIDKIEICFDHSSSDGSSNGDTITFGNRRSDTICRIYDKLLEQKRSGAAVDDSVSSWVRCELELKKSRSMAAFNAFCDKSPDEFVSFMNGVVNNYVSFINLDDSNRSRCSFKRWWVEFLGTSEKSKLTIPPFKPSTFLATSRWLNRSVFPTLAYFVKCIGFNRFLNMLNRFLHKEPSIRVKQMVDDYNTSLDQTINEIYDNLLRSPYRQLREDDWIHSLGLEPWLMVGCDEKQLRKDFEDYHVQFGKWRPFDDNTPLVDQILIDTKEFSYGL